MKKNRPLAFVVVTVVGAIAVFGLTVLIYATFFQDFLASFSELTEDELATISRDEINLVAIVIANLAHGFLLASVLTWGRAYTPMRGALLAGGVAFFTEIYFLFTQYAMFKTMDLVSAIADTIMWTLVNAIVGTVIAVIISRSALRITDATQAASHSV